MLFSKNYSKRHAKNILYSSYRLWKKKKEKLTPSQKSALESHLSALKKELESGSKEQWTAQAQNLEEFCSQNIKKKSFDYLKEFLIAIVLALVLATVIKQSWFELYEIPTGSMRPTFKEQDRLLVSKTAFGINIPLVTDHFYFDPSRVERGSIIIWSGDKMDMSDLSTNYFWLFPAVKRFIKRCMAKPGDTLYFYGGKIYGIDSAGTPLTELLEAPWLEKLEWIPFITFNGETKVENNQLLFQQMHQTLGRLTIGYNGLLTGEIFSKNKWIKDNAAAEKSVHYAPETYADFWGIKNYAMARLLTPEEFKQRTDLEKEGVEPGVLYLELQHNPSLTYPEPRVYITSGYTIELAPYSTVIPLEKRHVEALMAHMYTARFVINHSIAQRYALGEARANPNVHPVFAGIEDGTYEFYYGKAQKIGWGAIPTAVANSSPLYSNDAANVQKLFNLGVDFHLGYSPKLKGAFPHRYAYFRSGALYLLGGEIFKKGDPLLESFLKRELQKQEKSSQKRPYIAFRDFGSPVKEDGSWDKELIRNFGLTIPAKHYLMLGDNHAMSGDSRVFGFIPEENLQGVPTWLIWPPNDDRLGRPPQPPLPLFTLSRLIIWCVAVAIVIAFVVWKRRRFKRCLKEIEMSEKKG